MKTNIIFIFSILSILFVNSALACTQSVNQLFDKNLLVAYAAGVMNVDLAKASSIAINEYFSEFTGVDAGSNCSAYLNSQARISVSYKPNVFTQCSFSVTVHKTEQVGMTPDLSHPMLDISTESPISSCTIIPIILKPIPHPIPHL